MSRSRRKTPIIGNTTAKSEKWDKMTWHRRLRAMVRGALANDNEQMPDTRQASDPWTMAKDGRHWVSPLSKWMRK